MDSNGKNLQAGNLLEVSDVERRDGVTLLNRRRADQQVISRERDAVGRLFSTKLAGDFCGAVGNWVHRDMLLQFINKGATAPADFWRVGACHAVDEFSEGHCRDGDLNLSEGLLDGCEQIFHRLPFSFRCDITLESRIIPRREDSMVGCAL
jgi:hypothetical protein